MFLLLAAAASEIIPEIHTLPLPDWMIPSTSHYTPGNRIALHVVDGDNLGSFYIVNDDGSNLTKLWSGDLTPILTIRRKLDQVTTEFMLRGPRL